MVILAVVSVRGLNGITCDGVDVGSVYLAVESESVCYFAFLGSFNYKISLDWVNSDQSVRPLTVTISHI